MAQNLINATDLDFDQIKENLKTFFKRPDSPFKDWDYEGSGLSTLLDVLAHNTHYNALLAHMNVNESFIDTAQLRSSVISQAKLLGYLPGSAKCAEAFVNMQAIAGYTKEQTSKLVILRGTKFTASTENGTYTFVVRSTAEASTDTNGTYNFENLNLIQGTLRSQTFQVDTSIPNQKFTIDDDSIDLSTLVVSVADHQNTTAVETYTQFGIVPESSLGKIDNTSNVYFISQNTQGKYEISFGDGVIGKKLSSLNVVQVNYISTLGADVTGSVDTIDFAYADSTLKDSADNSITSFYLTNVSFSNGYDAESLDSIRFNAPNSLISQNRAVTANDYVSVIQKAFPNLIQAINVWGGESEAAVDPQNAARYAGQVYICIVPKNENKSSILPLSLSDRTSITDHLNTKRVMTVKTNFYDADSVHIYLAVGFKYNPNKTGLDEAALKTKVLDVIENYSTANLMNFTGVFRHSNLTSNIDQSDPAILNTDIRVYFYKLFDIPAMTSGTDVMTQYTSIPNALVSSYGNALYGDVDQNTSMLSSDGFRARFTTPTPSSMQGDIPVYATFNSSSTSVTIYSSPVTRPDPFLRVGSGLRGFNGTYTAAGAIITSISNGTVGTPVTASLTSIANTGSTTLVFSPTSVLSASGTSVVGYYVSASGALIGTYVTAQGTTASATTITLSNALISSISSSTVINFYANSGYTKLVLNSLPTAAATTSSMLLLTPHSISFTGSISANSTLITNISPTVTSLSTLSSTIFGIGSILSNMSGTGIESGVTIVSYNTSTNTIVMSATASATSSSAAISCLVTTSTYYIKDGPDANRGSTYKRKLYISPNTSSIASASNMGGTDICIGTLWPNTGRIEFFNQTYGTVTSYDMGTNTITDTSKSWATNELVGSIIYLIAGTGASSAGRIVSNTANTITIDTSAFAGAGLGAVSLADATTQYVVITSTINTWVNATGIKIHSRPKSLDVAPTRHQVLQIDAATSYTTIEPSKDTIALSGITGTNNYSTFPS